MFPPLSCPSGSAIKDSQARKLDLFHRPLRLKAARCFLSVRTHNTGSEHDIISERGYQFRLTLAVASLARLFLQLFIAGAAIFLILFLDRLLPVAFSASFFVVPSSFALKLFFSPHLKTPRIPSAPGSIWLIFFKAIIGSF